MPRRPSAFMSLLLVCASAHADFDVCNSGAKATIWLASASQDVSVFDHPYSLHGWSKIAPGACERIASGNVSGHAFWLHAEANGVTLTADYAVNGYANEKRFCITDGAFNDDDATAVSDEQSCRQGTRLATFPIWSHNPMYADQQVELNADEIPARPSYANSRTEYLPSLFGAVYFDKAGNFFADFLEKSAEVARTEALSDCRGSSPAAATCELRLEFADQCVAVIHGDKDPIFVVTGNHYASKEETRKWAMDRCKARGNSSCKESNVFCSTGAEQSAQRQQREEQLQQKVLDGMAEALKQIYK